jgi:hypothetical protein
MPVKDRKGIPHRGSEHRDIPDEFHPTNAFESRGADGLKWKPGLRHQTGFNSALGSDEHYFSFLSPRYPFQGDGQRGENVSARAASRNQQRQIALPCFRHMALPGCVPAYSACWLIFRSTPVAASITRRLEPP